MSDKMMELADFYKDICRLNDEQLDEFTHLFEKKELG